MPVRGLILPVLALILAGQVPPTAAPAPVRTG